ncbi:MAG: hypothetical protein U1E84_16455 [Rhodoferax sp.]
MQTRPNALMGWTLLLALVSTAHAAPNPPTSEVKKPLLSSKSAAPAKAAASKAPTRKAAAPEPVHESAPPEDTQPLSAELQEVANQVYVGTMSCELGIHVAVAPDTGVPGRFLLELGRQRFRMTPVLTSTGAVRLEDVQAGAFWLQLPNKSMLMSQKLGKRLADDCTGTEQSEIARALSRSPVPGILEARAPTPAPSEAVREEPAAVVLAEPAGVTPETTMK